MIDTSSRSWRMPLSLLIVVAISAAACSKDPIATRQEFIRSGDAYVAAHKLPEAIIEYRNAVQQDPRYAAAHQKLAAAYWQVGDRANAVGEFVRAADLLPNDPAAQIRAGNMLLLRGQYDDAQARADKALALDASSVDAQILKANALAGLDRLDDAVDMMEHAIAEDPARATSYAGLGAMELVRGDRVKAEAAFKKAAAAAPDSAPAHLALANFYLAVNRQAEAEQELKAAIALEPQNLLANRALAYFYLGSGQSDLAEPYLKKAASVSPDDSGRLALASYYVSRRRQDDARTLLQQIAAGGGSGATAARIQLASLSFNSGDTTAASSLIDEVLAKEPGNTRALTAKSELLAAAGKLDDALATARRAAEGDAQSALARFAVGKVRLLRHEDVDAATAFNDALQVDPHLAPAMIELARLDLKNGHLAQAVQLARNAASELPRDPEAQLLLARTQLAQGDVAAAEPVIRALASAVPKSPAVQVMLGALELRKHNPPAARAAFGRALDLDSANLDALGALVQMDLAEKQPAAARARLETAMRAHPKNPGLLLLASKWLDAAGDRPEAERLARQVIETSPDNLDAYAILGRIYVANHELPQATEQFQALAKRQPHSVPVHTAVGILLMMQNRTDEAKAAFEHVIEIDPGAAVAANNLAWINVEQGGNLDVALKLAQVAKAKLPDQPEVNDTLGWVLHKKGLDAMAVTPLEAAVGRDSSNASYQYHLGAVYAAVGSKAKARAALNAAVRLAPASADARAARGLLPDVED